MKSSKIELTPTLVVTLICKISTHLQRTFDTNNSQPTTLNDRKQIQ